MDNKDIYKKGQMIWWNIFEYHTQGMLNDSEFAELMDAIYYFRQDKEKFNTLTLSPKVKLVWQTLKETIRKSDSNHNGYEKRKTQSTTTSVNQNERKNKEELTVVKNGSIKPNEGFNNTHMQVDEPEPIFTVTSEPIEIKKRYYDFDTKKSETINRYLA